MIFFFFSFAGSGAAHYLHAIQLSVIPNPDCPRPNGMFCTMAGGLLMKGICFVSVRFQWVNLAFRNIWLPVFLCLLPWCGIVEGKCGFCTNCNTEDPDSVAAQDGRVSLEMQLLLFFLLFAPRPNAAKLVFFAQIHKVRRQRYITRLASKNKTVLNTCIFTLTKPQRLSYAVCDAAVWSLIPI